MRHRHTQQPFAWSVLCPAKPGEREATDHLARLNAIWQGETNALNAQREAFTLIGGAISLSLK